MTSISALIDFLMSLMRDEDTKQAFQRDPDGTLTDRGLRDVTAQDVQDARLIMADEGTVRPRPDGESHSSGHHSSGYHDGGLTAGGGGPVREILHTTNTFEIDQSTHVDQTILAIDNRDTTIIDSFNSQDEVTAIQDNDTVNNDIDVINVADSFNGEEDTGDPGEPDGTSSPAEQERPFDIGEPVTGPADGEARVQPAEDEPPEDEPFDPDPELEPHIDPEPDLPPVDEPTEDEPGLAAAPVA